jgi:trans-aconitate methyltransferase
VIDPLQPTELDGLGGYAEQFPFHDENLLMLEQYANRFASSLKSRGVRRLLSLGIGHRVVSRRLGALLGAGVESYTVVEGSAARIAELAAGGGLPAPAQVVHSLFEEYTPERAVDAIEMGFVLEHVIDPGALLRRFRRFLSPTGFIGVAVPNARSLHRLVGARAGLLGDPYQLSEHDLALGHRRYFDLESVTRLVEDSGLRATAREGLYLKCLTTAQLRALRLTPKVMAAFCEVAVDYPEIANAIYLEAQP